MSDTRRINERYHLEKKVSSKETVSVYRATDTLSGETVAVKLIDADNLEERRERFQESARLLQSIHHPALPLLLDSGLTAAGSAFLVTEFLHGAGFDHLAGEPAVRTLGLLLFAVDGLEALALAGLAHGNLRADNLFVVEVAGGEEVKLLGLGSGVLREPATATDDFRNDLRDFASLTAGILGATMIPGTGQPGDGQPRVEWPAGALAGLGDPETLRAFLDNVLRGDSDLPGTPAARLTSWSAVRQELRHALVGGHGRATEGRRADEALPGSGTVRVSLRQLRQQMEQQNADELKTRLFRPEDLAPAPPPLPVSAPPPISPPPAPAPAVTPPPVPAAAIPAPPAVAAPPMPPPPPPRKAAAPPPAQPARSKALLFVAAGVLGLLGLAAAGGIVVWKLRKPPAPPPPPVAVQKPVATPVPVAPTPAAPPQVNPQILLAEGFVTAGDLAKAKAAIEAIPPDQTLSADEQERIQRVAAALAPLQQAQQEAGGLARALSGGDARALRSAVDAVRPDQEAALSRQARRDLIRARKILDLDAKLARTEKEGHALEIVRQASALLAEQPKNARAAKTREDAAVAIETEAEAKAQAGQLDAAATRLEQLRDAWPARHGLADRIEHLRSEDRTNREMDDLLAGAARAGQAGKPLDGLRILSGARPPARYADRFRDAKARLDAQFAQLDQRPPDIKLRKEADKLAYDKNATVVVPLRITDDFGVETTGGWARPEGGQYTAVELRKVNGTDYEMEIPPALHDNKTIEIYVTAADRSGHKSQLGSAGSPIRIKKKGFFSKILGKKD